MKNLRHGMINCCGTTLKRVVKEGSSEEMST